MRTKRISAEEFGWGRWVRVGVECTRHEWEVVERHPDGSVTVVDLPESPRVDWLADDWLTGRAQTRPALTEPAPRPVEHDIRHVRGPLNRRYRCMTCPWEGPIPAEHPT